MHFFDKFTIVFGYFFWFCAHYNIIFTFINDHRSRFIGCDNAIHKH